MKRLLIRVLLRCYPRAWRRRYGEEFAALLDQAPLDAAQLADALRGVLDVRRRRGKQAMMALGAARLDPAERRFWRRWVAALACAGGGIGLVRRLLPLLFDLDGVSVTRVGLGQMLWWQTLILGPLLLLVALGLGVAQWRALRPLLPGVSGWWAVATLLGPLAALAIMTVDRGYRTLPDLMTMTHFFLSSLSQVASPTEASRIGGTYDRILAQLLPALCFCGIASACQSLALRGSTARGGWWIGVSSLAAIAGVGAAQLCNLLQYRGGQFPPERVWLGAQAAQWVGFSMLQFAAACAAYGVVSGLGLIILRRIERSALASATARVAR